MLRRALGSSAAWISGRGQWGAEGVYHCVESSGVVCKLSARLGYIPSRPLSVMTGPELSIAASQDSGRGQ